MVLQYLRGGLAAAVIAGGVTVGVSYAQQRDGGLLPPNESGMVTVTGCLVRGNQVRDGDSDKYVAGEPKNRSNGQRTHADLHHRCECERRSARQPREGEPERVDAGSMGGNQWQTRTGNQQRQHPPRAGRRNGAPADI